MEVPSVSIRVDLSKVRRQVEFYFSHRNLSRDLRIHEAAVEGWLNTSWLLQCPKLRRQGVTLDDLRSALKESEILEFDEEALKEHCGAWPPLSLPSRPGGTVLVLQRCYDFETQGQESSETSASSSETEESKGEDAEVAMVPGKLQVDGEDTNHGKNEAVMDLDANPTPASVDPAEESSGEGPPPKEGDAAAAKLLGRAAARQFLRDWKIPKSAICGLSDLNSFGEIVVALHPFPGDQKLLATCTLDTWLPRMLFGSQRAKALQCLPKRVRRELLEGPSQEIQQTFAAKLEKRLRMKLATPLVR
eukprot:symbB.v1.2.000953.t1/scaffold45.1/size390604/16